MRGIPSKFYDVKEENLGIESNKFLSGLRRMIRDEKFESAMQIFDYIHNNFETHFDVSSVIEKEAYLEYIMVCEHTNKVPKLFSKGER